MRAESLKKPKANQSEEFDLIFKDKDGSLRDKITNAHVFVFSRSAFRSMTDLLYERFQSGASVILYDMGQGYGKKVASGLMKRGMDAQNALKTIERLASMAGWGEFQFQGHEGAIVGCVVSNNMFTILNRQAGPRACYFLAGLLAGNAMGAYSQDFRAEESECISDGSDRCKFRIFRV